MPQVIGTTNEDSGSVVTNFTGTATTSTQTFTFTEEQDGMTFRNKGFSAVTVTVDGVTYNVPPVATVEIDDQSFSSFDVRTASDSQSFEIKSFVLKSGKATNQEIQDIRASLAEKATPPTVKTSILFSQAVAEINQTVFNLPNVANALKKNTLKIAFWGDSITEGFNNYKDDIYVERFMAQLIKSLPGVTVEYFNFAIASRGISNALNSNYLAANPETDKNVDFWRSWATVGKSWRQHIVDYNPDLVVVAFGMNDVSNNLSDFSFYNNLSALKSFINTSLPKSDIALVSTMMPTEEKTVYNQSSERTLQIARATREFAKNNNLALIDTNRLWRILRYGVEEERFTVTELSGVADITDKVCYNGELKISLSTYPAYASGTDVVIRSNGNEGGILIRFYNSTGQNKIDVYSMDSGMSNGGTGVLSGAIAQATNIIKFEGANLYINGQKITLYKHLRDGKVYVKQNAQNISSITLIQRIPFTETTPYSEKDLLGNVNWASTIGTTGNGINHPSSLGYYLAYYMATMGLLNSIQVVKPVVFQYNGRKQFLFKGFMDTPNTPPYTAIGATGKPIYYIVYPETIDKRAVMELIDPKNGKVFKKSSITNIANLGQLADFEFVVFDGSGDTQPTVQNLFITGYADKTEITDYLIHYVYQ